MTLLNVLLALAVVSAQASPWPTLATHAPDGFASELAAAVLRTEFTSAADREFLARAAATAPAHEHLRFALRARGHEAVVVTEVVPAFTLARASRPGEVLLNGRRLHWRGHSLRRLLAEVEAALGPHRVARAPWWLPRAEAAAPVLFLVSLSALVVYFGWEAWTDAPDPSVRFTELTKLCRAEREARATTFAQSETARAWRGLGAADDGVEARAFKDCAEQFRSEGSVEQP